MDFYSLKIAIIHDWLVSMRGGEKIVENLCEMFPGCDIYTLLYRPGSVSPVIETHKIYTSFVNQLPFKNTKYRYYLPLFPTAIEKFNIKPYDLIISSSHCVAKGIIPSPDTLHVSYIHTPMRYVWDMYHDYFEKDNTNLLIRKLIPFFANYLRMWDVASANRVDWFIANSQHVANRIKKYYGRESTIIHPPVEIDLFSVNKKNDNYYLIVSALVPYKRVDLAIQAFNEMKKPLLIVGEGPSLKRLQSLAGPTIQFIKWQPLTKLSKYYEGCKALIFPGEEDFGIAPVEAQLCGKPVIALGKGGALETIIGFDDQNEKKCTGIFFYDQSVESLIHAVTKFENIEWDTSFIHSNAKKFSKDRFKSEMMAFIEGKMEQFLEGKYVKR